MATVVAVERRGGNIDITLRCPFTSELRIDQSIAHNGVCLTVTAIDGECYTVTAIEETLRRSNLGLLEPGSRVNVERSMRVNRKPSAYVRGLVSLLQARVNSASPMKSVNTLRPREPSS